MTTPFTPVNFDGESLRKEKFQQLSTNVQWLFDNRLRARFVTASGVPRESQVKMIAGKTPFPLRSDNNFVYVQVYFGSFFSAACKPVVVTGLESTSGNMHRGKVTAQGRTGELDYTGFMAVVSIDPPYTTVSSTGWIHWLAVGF